MRAHCLFEQSGTFKNEFKKLGIEAFDYDILNDYGQTDYVVDLYKEIEGGYYGEHSIFDNIKPDDIILAFFPCTRFEAQITLWYRGEAMQQKNASDIEKLEKCLKLHEELSENYKLITMLAIIVLRKGLKMVFENPWSEQHYLTRYWCLKPAIIDMNRRENGDYMKKPTQYWCIGFKPYSNLIWEPLEYVEYRTHTGMRDKDGKSKTVRRSEIHPQYASRFIRQYLIEWDQFKE
jgi:hypothetical protein